MGSNIRIFFRTLVKHKWSYSANLLGQIGGILSIVLGFSYVISELSYDKHLENLNRIVNISTVVKTDRTEDHLATANGFLVRDWKDKFEEIEEFVRLKKIEPDCNVKVDLNEDIRQFEDDLFFAADKSILSAFSLQVLRGNPDNALELPNSAVLTKSLALKYFGTIDVLDRTIDLNNENYKITGVINDVTPSSSVRFDALVSFSELDYYNLSWGYTFLLLKTTISDESLSDFEVRLNLEARSQLEGQYNDDVLEIYLIVERLSDLHFSKAKLYDLPKGNVNYLVIIATCAFLMLIMVVFNNTNFLFIQGVKRHKQLGIINLLGQSGKPVIIKFALEAVLLSLMASISTSLIIFSFQTDIRIFFDTDVSLFSLIAYCLALGVMIGCLTSLYPAIYFSRQKIGVLLRGISIGRSGNYFRNSLIFGQFVISLLVVLFTSGINNQLKYLLNTDLGFSKDRVLIIDIPEAKDVQKNLKVFEDKLYSLPFVNKISRCGSRSIPGTTPNFEMFKIGSDEERKFAFIEVDEKYLELLNIDIETGRTFQSPPSEFEFIVNKELIKNLSIENPLGLKINKYTREGKIIGVSEDFHFESMHKKIEPLIMYINFRKVRHLMIQLNEKESGRVIDEVRVAWLNTFQESELGYHFLDDIYEAQYAREKKLSLLFQVLSYILVFVAIGGIVSFSALAFEQRKKELSLRKCFGASLIDLAKTILKVPFLLVILSSALSIVIVREALAIWLREFMYKDEPTIWIYFPGILLILLIVLLSYFIQIIRVNKTKEITFIQSN